MITRFSRSFPSRRSRWIHTSACALAAAKPVIDAPAPPPPPPLDSHVKANTGTKGRKQARKVKRHPTTIPEPLIKNVIGHDAMQPQALDPVYQFPESLWQELKYSIHAGFAPKATMASFDHSDHVALALPKPGATHLQDTLARQLAQSALADLVILDAQDFLALAEHNAGHAMSIIPIVSRDSSNLSTVLTLQSTNDEDPDDGVEEANQSLWLDAAGDATKLVNNAMDSMVSQYSRYFRSILQHQDSSRTLVYLRDFGDMHDTFGSLMLKALMAAVEDLRQQGLAVVLFAGYSPPLDANLPPHEDAEDEKDTSKDWRKHLVAGMKCLQWDGPFSTAAEQQLEHDAAQRIAEYNARQLVLMHLHKRVVGMHPVQVTEDLYQLEGIRDVVWSPEEIDRRVTVAMGRALQDNRDCLLPMDFIEASNIVQANLQSASLAQTTTKPRFTRSGGSLDLAKLKKECSSHEARLFSRIVDPSKVDGSFKEIRAPPSTIDTLQTLISLPLQRPDLFQHGILKRNAIHGVLLFGPPGTGKTMLAKAVAKESGSRMLEIQASDVYEMYVGEGEKNVKAIFSLARKLSPCVIFIDEVDSVMNRRRSETSSNAHREIINQLMVEWDGLSSNNQGVVVMAATNRPFDLDDAVLRRMPRRVLVDLPKEDDRKAILEMLLQDEQHNLSIDALAKSTQHYSGSDLKNLCVTAALRCLQQQLPTLETASQRSLSHDHFDHALKLVPASSSDDMQSLVEIRKWAQKYGDGHQKKPTPTFGFQ
ncbi:AAA-domain-containing protein [Hesseltinella vesiculosa]|uniref:AAA-domain-containing protein n=1 Tax=Hesseltinella vesiculosa TaxID=101127 RepID=A0A1X2GVH7_9FUNG|nr:AAA-domain-containing protein [Hesseltinella vesiculosa]